MVSQELSRKLETGIELNFADLHAHDLTGRAQAFKKLTQGGMTATNAAVMPSLMELQGTEA